MLPLTCPVSLPRFILHAKKTGFVVEHDFIMATYLADRVIVFDGQPSIDTAANSPQVRDALRRQLIHSSSAEMGERRA